MELCGYLESCGVDGNRMIAMNIGGTVGLENGVSLTMVHAVSFFHLGMISSFIPLELALLTAISMVVKPLVLFFTLLMVFLFSFQMHSNQ